MRVPETDKKILAIALEGAMPVQAAAVYTKKTLVFSGIKNIMGGPDEWRDTIEETIAERIAKNWVVLVEDKTGSFSDRAILFDFDRTGDDGRTYLQQCLDWYFALQARGALVFPEDMQRYTIRAHTEGAMLDFGHDEKGRLLYKVNWAQFSPGHRAMLMCIAGAILEDPASDRWLNHFLGLPEPMANDSWSKMLRHIHAVSVGHTLRLGAEFEERVKATEARKTGRAK